MRFHILLLGCAVLLVGCIQPFRGSWVQQDLTGVKSPCTAIMGYKLTVPPGGKACTGNELDDRFLYHYEIWATVNKSGAVYVASFIVQPHLITQELLDMEQLDHAQLPDGSPFWVADTVPWGQLSTADQDTTKARMRQAEVAWAIVKHSTGKYEPGTKRMMQDFYVGNFKQLTRPRNGFYYGQVHGPHPLGTSTLGGASFTTDASLDNLDSLWITIERSDDPARAANPTPSNLVLLQGASKHVARGITNVDATCPYGDVCKQLVATFSVQADLGDQEYF